jgi:hypothetical protein
MVVDTYALIVQRNGDGGDTLQREGMYAFGKWLRYSQESNTVVIADPPERRDPSSVMDRLEVRPGVFVRHPDPSKWYSNPATVSRDQLVPVFAYCAAYEDYPRLWRLFTTTAQRGFFAPNTTRAGAGHKPNKMPDTMLGHLGLFIRAGGYWTMPFYPLLFLTDTVDLVGTLLHQIPVHWEQTNRRLRFTEARDVDDNNTIIQHLMAAHFKPTPISWANRQIYAFGRRLNNGNLYLGENNPVMGALAWYHRAEAGGNPEIAELYRPAIEQYFNPMDDYQRFRIELSSLINRFSERLLTSSL